MDCIFCKINNNEIPSYTIYEDEIIRVILDINQDVCGHALIIPKKHYVDIADIDNDVLYHIMDIYKKMYKLYQTKLHIDGFSINQNNGTAQDVKHFHLHLIPKYNNNPNYDIKDVYNILK